MALFACLTVGLSAAAVQARVPVHATTTTSADAFWILGPAGEGGVRYASAGLYEKNQDGDVFRIAYAYIGTCKARSGSLSRCRTERSVSDDDFEPVFFMDPSMQVATLQLGPHRVSWEAAARTPWVSFYGVACDPDDEDADGPNLTRGALARGELFGRKMSSDDHPSGYGFLSRGAIVSECAFRSGLSPRRLDAHQSGLRSSRSAPFDR